MCYSSKRAEVANDVSTQERVRTVYKEVSKLKTLNSPIRKWEEGETKRHFTEEDGKEAHEDIEQHLPSGKCNFKTTRRYHYIPGKMATTLNARKDAEKRGCSELLVGT